MMEEKQAKLNYEEEADKLSDSEWWKPPKEGQAKIVFLEELNAPLPRDFQRSDGTTETVMQTDVLIEHDKKQYKWSLTQGKSEKSLWGQLISYAKLKGGLVGHPVTLLIKKDSQGRRDYTILELAQAKSE